jgi:hemolysin activation/secretion protein
VIAILSPPLAAQQVTPGAVQETLKKRPELPPTPRDLPITEPAARPTVPVAPGGKKIPIQRFEVSGNEVISTDELRGILAPYEGQSLTLFEIYDVADALTRYYRDRGYSVASVNVPAQKVSTGVVRLEVIEGRIGSIAVDGNKRYRTRSLERYLGDIAVGDVIQRSALEEELLLLNDLPGLTARAVVEPGDEFGESNFVLRAEEDLIDSAARLNNYGRVSIGEWRLEGDLGVNAPFGWGDRLEVNAVWADSNNLNYLSGRYSVPILYRGTRASVYYSSYNYEIHSTENGGFPLLDITGDGDNFGANVAHPIIRSRRQNLFVTVGFDRTVTRQLTEPIGVKAKRDIGLLVLTGLYSREHADQSFTTVGAIFSTNFDSNDRNRLTGLPENNAQTAKLRIDASHYRALGGLWAFQVRGTAVGSIDPLVDTERFRIGGRENVRAYASSELAGDGGYALSLEVFRYFNFTPNLPASASLFIDTGTVTRKDCNTVVASGVVQAGLGLGCEGATQSISGAGFAFETFFKDHYKVNFELAHHIGTHEAFDGRRGVRLWAGISSNF